MRNGEARPAVRHIPDHTADWWRVCAEYYFGGTTHRMSEAFSFVLTLLKHGYLIQASGLILPANV
jgi:hypothetical protein